MHLVIAPGRLSASRQEVGAVEPSLPGACGRVVEDEPERKTGGEPLDRGAVARVALERGRHRRLGEHRQVDSARAERVGHLDVSPAELPGGQRLRVVRRDVPLEERSRETRLDAVPTRERCPAVCDARDYERRPDSQGREGPRPATFREHEGQRRVDPDDEERDSVDAGEIGDLHDRQVVRLRVADLEPGEAAEDGVVTDELHRDPGEGEGEEGDPSQGRPGENRHESRAARAARQTRHERRVHEPAQRRGHAAVADEHPRDPDQQREELNRPAEETAQEGAPQRPRARNEKSEWNERDPGEVAERDPREGGEAREAGEDRKEEGTETLQGERPRRARVLGRGISCS